MHAHSSFPVAQCVLCMSFVNMLSPNHFLGLTVLAAAAAGASSIIDTTFYPQALNNTASIANASLGAFGGLPTAPADEESNPVPYGTYDYCTMPHPRVDGYASPAAVQNGSVKAQLVYLEYLQRHQRRTPYNILPSGEDQEYHCDNILPYLYAGPATGQAPMQVYAATYTDPSNPFVTGYVKGSCQYPQLTIGGLLDGFQHGRDLWAIYGEKLGLLPAVPQGKRAWFRSSTSPLTQGSAGAVLRGIWPDYNRPIPLHQQASSVDTVNEGFSCPFRDKVLGSIEASKEWTEHLNVTQPLRDCLAATLNVDDSSWMTSFDHFADNFQARLCNGYELPCGRSDNSSQCVTQAQAAEAFRAGDWEWNYYYRGNENATLYIQLVEGLFIKEIHDRLDAVEKGQLDQVYSHNFVHDDDIGPVLGALGIEELRWPGMGSNIAFEIWKTHNAQFYARVLYSGHPIRTVHGTLEWVPLSTLTDILKPFIPADIVSLCSS